MTRLRWAVGLITAANVRLLKLYLFRFIVLTARSTAVVIFMVLGRVSAEAPASAAASAAFCNSVFERYKWLRSTPSPTAKNRNRAESTVYASTLPRSPLRLKALERSEEHTSELQSLTNLVCRLLLEKQKEHRHEQRLENLFHCAARADLTSACT